MSTLFAITFFASLAALLHVLKSDIHRAIAKAFGFVVIGNGYTKRHYAIRFKEATAWAACYGDGANIYKRGIWVASKMHRV